MDKKDKDILKMSKLLKHWASHNDSHEEGFLKWRDIAKSKGLNTVVDNLNKAIEMMDKCTHFLLKACDELE
ncbi:MAG: hypothetical protein ACTSUT_09205 [Promethearchaeota archaeon]